MSPRTIYLGKLIGLYCILLSLAMLSHKQATVDTMNALIHNAPILFLACIMAVLGGLAIVLAHNVWSGGALPVVITLVGWLILFKGLVFLFLPPEMSVAYFEAFHYGQMFYLYASVDLALGIYLSFSSFRASR